MVSQPDGESRGALILLPGYGRPARSGVNGFWTRIARELAGRGAVVLRFDYSLEGESFSIGKGGSGGQAWKRALDMLLLSQVVRWLRERIDGLPLHLAGVCGGARFAIDFAGREPEAVAGLFLIVPHLRGVEEQLRPGRDDADSIDPTVLRHLRAILDRAPAWVVVGERDTPNIPLVKGMLGPTPHELELEVVPGAALHFLDQPDIQEQARSRLVNRVGRALAECEPVDRSDAATGPRRSADATS